MPPELLYPLLTTALYYLFARAEVTRWLWSRYPAWLDGPVWCAACSGTWYGVACYGLLRLHVPFFGLEPSWWVAAIAGLCSLVWTPLLAALHDSAMGRLGSPPEKD